MLLLLRIRQHVASRELMTSDCNAPDMSALDLMLLREQQQMQNHYACHHACKALAVSRRKAAS